jgi:hypothetical protein
MAVQTSYSTNLAVAFEGMRADSGPCDVWSMVNNEGSAEIPFGHAVAFEGSTDDQGALSPDALADILAGIVLHSHDYSNSPNGDLGTTGLKPGAALNVLRKGRIWGRCADGCSPGDRLFVRVLGGTEGELRASADGVNTIDASTQGVWLTTAAAGELAVLEVDFTNTP